MTKIKKTLVIALMVCGLLSMSEAAKAQVVINECYTGVPDWCEIANFGGSTVNIGGWTLIMNDDPTASSVFTFPANTMIASFETIVVSENATNPALPAGTQRFTATTNINWANSGAGSCALNDSSGVGQDYITWLNATNLPTGSPLAPWTGSITSALNSLYRNTTTDSNTTAGWATDSSAGTPGALNTGQVAPPMPPVASFTSNVTNVLPGTSVNFSDTSSGTPSTWAWDLDGDSVVDSNAKNPSFNYTTLGSYDVTLTVTNGLGSDSVTMTNYITVAAAPGIPYTNNFSAALGGEWNLSSTGTGRIRLLTDTPTSPLSGGDALVMDSSVDNSFGINSAELRIDYAATGGGILRYYARETGDEAHSNDGVFISNGVTEVRVVDHDILSSAWQEITVDLNIEAGNAGMVIDANFYLIFRQEDNYTLGTDGVLIDDIRITPPPVPDVGQANSAFATMDLNSGLNLNLRPATVGEKGPFFAAGDTLDFSFSGDPGQAFQLYMGPLNRNHYIYPGHGSLDIGLLPGQNYSDIQIVLDGLGLGIFDYLARTDATGSSSFSVGVSALPLGVIGTFQAAMYNVQPSIVELTAAFEFTVQ